MKKILVSAAAFVLAVSMFTACGGSASSAAPAESTPAGEPASSSAEAAASDLAGMVSTIEAVNTVANPIDIDEMALEFDMLIDPADVVSFAGVKSNDDGNCATVLVLQAAEGKADALADTLNTYKADQAAMYSNYADDFSAAIEQIENGVVSAKGDYVVMVFANTEGASYDEIGKAVESVLG